MTLQDELRKDIRMAIAKSIARGYTPTLMRNLLEWYDCVVIISKVVQSDKAHSGFIEMIFFSSNLASLISLNE